MLGGKAPSVDKDLIVSWFARDWEERAFPGAPYAQGARAAAGASARRCSTWTTGAAEGLAQRPAGRAGAGDAGAHARLAERAYTLLKSEAHNEPIEDWIASQRGGPDMALVFEAANGASLDTVRVPAFFTYAGFYVGLLDPMPTIADNIAEGELGARRLWRPGRGQAAICEPVSRTFSSWYCKEFVAAWNAALGNLQLRPLLADKPEICRARRPPRRRPRRSVDLRIRSRRDGADARAQEIRGRRQARPSRPRAIAVEAGRTPAGIERAARRSISAMKSQRGRAIRPPRFPARRSRPISSRSRSSSTATRGSRPIDALLANLNELYRQLALAADNPSQAKQALDQVEVQVASLRAQRRRACRSRSRA